MTSHIYMRKWPNDAFFEVCRLSTRALRQLIRDYTYEFHWRRGHWNVLDDHWSAETTALSDHRTKRTDDKDHDGYASAGKCENRQMFVKYAIQYV